MRVFVAGATGVLGPRIVAECTDRGHEVVGLSRTETGDDIVRESGGQPWRGDVFDRDSLVKGADGADVIVHAATRIPTARKPDDAAWTKNDRVRREGAEHLVAAAASVGAERFVQQSIVWVARQPDGSPFDETAAPNPDRTTRSALDAESIVAEASERHGFDPVVLRCGLFHAADATNTRQIGEGVLAGRMPIVGGGVFGRNDATLSWLHVNDAARAFTTAIDGGAGGTYHVVDDEPVALSTYLATFADRLGASSPRRVPAWFARLFVGKHVARLLSQPMPTTNDRFRSAFDWRPRYPTYREALDRIVDTWRADGTLRETERGYEWMGE